MFGHASKSHYISLYSHISFYYVLSLSIIHSILPGPFCPEYACRDLSGSNLFVYKNMAFSLDYWTLWMLLAKLLFVDQRWNTWRVKICDVQPNLPLLTFVLLLFPMRFGRVMFLRNLNVQLLRNKPISESCRSSKSDRNRWIRWTGRVKKLPSCGSNCDVPL